VTRVTQTQTKAAGSGGTAQDGKGASSGQTKAEAITCHRCDTRAAKAGAPWYWRTEGGSGGAQGKRRGGIGPLEIAAMIDKEQRQ
jgi:hypothetical protein